MLSIQVGQHPLFSIVNHQNLLSERNMCELFLVGVLHGYTTHTHTHTHTHTKLLLIVLEKQRGYT